jgi:integrase
MKRRSGGILYLTDDERQALFAAIKDARDRAMFTLGFWRGLRAGEIALLRLEHWHPNSGRLYVRRLKGSISQEYLLTMEELRALKAWLRVRGKVPGPLFAGYHGRGLERHAVTNLMRRYATAAGLPEEKRHWHCLKHSCGTFLFDHDEPVQLVQDHLGHADIRSTMKYAKVTQRKRDEMAERLSGLRGG